MTSLTEHPTIYEIGQTDDIHFIATEFIDGVILRQRITNAEMELKEILESSC